MKIYEFLKKFLLINLTLKLNYFKYFLIKLKFFINKVTKIYLKQYFLYNNYIVKINTFCFI